MARDIFIENFDGFEGNGFNIGGTGGALDSDFWTVAGFNSGADLTRGITDGGVSTGGLYALEQSDSDNALYIQPGGSDFTPGTLDVTFNVGPAPATGLTVSFDRIVLNDQARANSFNLTYSVDGGATFLPLDAFTSDEAADGSLSEVTVSAALPDLAAGTQVTLRWESDDVSGGGSRDEFGIDNVRVTADDLGDPVAPAFTLELLHFADQEAGAAAVADAPNLSAVLNALQAQDLGNDGEVDNTLILSSGDAIIPGLFFDASEDVFGYEGIADIQIQNELGVQAIALGNHEFDFGTRTLSELITGQDVTDDSDPEDGFVDTVPQSIGGFDALTTSDLAGTEFGGADFTYLSTNLVYAADDFMAPLEVAGGQAPQAKSVSSSVVIDTNGEAIGVVGATTPTLDIISSPGDLGILPGDFDATPTSDQLDALAAEIQKEVDALLAANPAMNKVILLAHMQQLSIELGLAERLENVDVIVAGGSNTRLFDDNDVPRAGDSDQGQYPQFVTNAGGTTTAVVNTDGSYKYVGRLVLDFDADGNIIADSYDADVSGAYATDEAGVAALGAGALVDPEIQAIADAIEAQIIATESNVFGGSDVFLNGNRSGIEGDADGVRTQETNLGNLTADANLAAAKAVDSAVVVSIKNGGGIRASIGEDIVLPGDTDSTRLPNGEVVDGDGNVIKPAGGISQNDISTTLAFNNDLSLMTLTKAELVAVLEHGVSALPNVAGQFPQVSGVEFSFDPDLPAGARIVNAEIVEADGTSVAELVRDGTIVGDVNESFRIVTLNFLAGGGDGFPFPQTDAANRIDLTDLNQDGIDDGTRDGVATFADTGTEQDALAEYLSEIGTFTEADTTQAEDSRIQNLNFRADTIFDGDTGTDTDVVINEVLASTTGTDSEYVELFGAPGASLAGLSFIAVESNDASNLGNIEFRHDFAAGDAIGGNGFFLLANETAQLTYGVTPNGALTASLENSSATYALVETASLTGDSVTGAEVVLDSVASIDSSASTPQLGAPVVGPDGNFFPAGVGRIEDGVDTDTADDFEILSFGNSTVTNTPTAGTAQQAEVVINEVLASTTGTDSEYVELFGTPGGSLAGLSFIAIESNDGSTLGDIEFRFDFADDVVMGDNGFLLLANETAATTYGVEPNINIGANSLENSSATYALVETASLTGDAVTGAEVVIDSVASIDSSASTPQLGAPAVGPDGNFFPAGVGRVEDGVDTDSADDFQILNFFNEDPNAPTVGTGLGGGTGGGSIDDPATLISAIQGTDDTAALVGDTVVVEGIVTGDFQNGDADDFRSIGGFFVQEELADEDGDDATSEGIFIYEGDGDTTLDVAAGDKVRVLGTVTERFGKTTINVAEVQVVEDGAADPLSLAKSIALPDADAREAYESMLITIDEALTFTESFDYEDFGVATLSTDGPVYQFTQLNEADVAGNTAYQAEVANRLISIDNGTDGRRSDFDPITAPDGTLLGGENTIRHGQSIDDLTAILDYSFGDFSLRLPEGVAFDLDEATNPEPEAPLDVGSDYKVATLNVLNYFTTIDGATDIGGSPRGADDLEELERQTDKLVEAIIGLDADVIGLVELENDFEGDSFAVQTLVDEINTSLGSTVYDFVYPGQEFVGDDVIAVGFIYDVTTTVLVGDAAILDTQEFQNPLGAASGGDTFNRAALAQTFEEIETGGVYTAAVNHFKSKGSLTGAPEDNDQGDGAGNNNATRTEAAKVLADWLATDPTGSGDEDILILGDLNAYAKEGPILALEDKGYTDLAASFEGEEVYSFRFSGQIGTLDYILSNDSLTGQVTGADTWHINADTPVIFDYNTDDTFTSPNTLRPTDQALFDGTSPARASDHDPLVIGLNLTGDREPENLIVNGDFEAHETLTRGPSNQDRGWDLFDSIEGWTATRNFIELQEGAFGTGNVAGNTVVELDARRNATIEQIVEVSEAGIYALSFDFGARGNNANNNAFDVLVNGEVVASLAPSAREFQTKTVYLELETDPHTSIAFAATGTSNGIGGIIDNVELIASELPENLVVNGDFEAHPELGRGSGNRAWDQFGSIVGWTATRDLVELQDGAFNSANPAGNTVLELDARRNATVEQKVNIFEDGLYEFSFDFGARGKNAADNAFEVAVNGEIVAALVPASQTFETFSVLLELDAEEDATIEFIATGTSNGRGGLIDNVSLVLAPETDVADATLAAFDEFQFV